MSKPHLVIRGGRVLQFNSRERAANWLKAFGHLHGGVRSPFSTDPKTFREWKERKSRFILAKGSRDALPGVEGRRFFVPKKETVTARMLEAWRTRGPLFGREGRQP